MDLQIQSQTQSRQSTLFNL